MTTDFWTLDRVAEALSQRVTSPAPRGLGTLRGITTDTRALRSGDCFVALIGVHFDAHDFLEQAVAAGAVALVVSRAPRIGVCNVPVYVVDDTLVALGDLAHYRRIAWGGPVVAVAGSNGKTSTKELLRAALASRLSVHATTGNLNNRIGVPQTILAIPDDADVAVIELGTSVPGEIAALRAITRPDVAIVTSIAEEHLEGFGDLAGVLAEESAVFPEASVAIIPSDEAALVDAARGAGRVVRAGLAEGEVCAQQWQLNEDGSGKVTVDGVVVHSALRGVHNLRNLMLALAGARELGVSVQDAARGIGSLTPPPMRASWDRVGSALVINDAYNSNPGSAIAALEMLTAAPGQQKVAILGTMRELGANSARCHDDVSRAAVASTASIIAGIGEFVESLGRVAGMDDRVVTAPDVDQLWAALQSRLSHDATILLKASRGVKLERILPHISRWAMQGC